MNENTRERGSSSSEDDEDGASEGEDEADQSGANFRRKRQAEGFPWCSVESEIPVKKEERAKVSWPPSASDVNFTDKWRNLRPVANIFFANKLQLHSRTGYFLAVYPDGAVRGTKDDSDVHTHLQITNADNHVGHVRIKGMLSNLFVAMDETGRLYGEAESSKLATIFVEAFQGSYMAYMSLKYAHLGWYLGVKKSGKFKRGPKTAYGQKAVMFLQSRRKFQ